MLTKSNVILCGYKSCGKTTIGAALAKTVGRDFIDTDQLIEQYYYHQTYESLSIRLIYEKVGEEKFRHIEMHIVTQLLSMKNKVIATGGGTMNKKENQLVLKKIGTIVYLHLSEDKLHQRMKNNTLPAFIDKENSENSINQYIKSRRKIYDDAADVIIDTDNKKIEQIVQLIIQQGLCYGKQ